MIQTLDILKGYITCEDPATRNKFFNLLDSFWHKQDGKVLKETVIGQDGTTTFKFLNADGTIHSVALPALPNSKPISFIQNLSEELAKLQPKVTGKGLSTHDLNTELLNKLNSLQNYQHPLSHQIAEVEGLPEALEGKQPIAPEGYGFSQADFTENEKIKLASYNLRHYGNPVNDLIELAALTQEQINTKQRRYVHSEGCDYFYDANLLEGDVAPNDQGAEAEGFWVKGINTAEIIDNLLSFEPGIALSANQGRVLKGLIDNINTILGSDDTTLDELQEVVDFIKMNREDLQNLSVDNIAGLIDALAGKLDRGGYAGTAANLKTLIDGKADTNTTNTFTQLQTFLGGLKTEFGISIKHVSSEILGEINIQPLGIRFSKNKSQGSYIQFNYDYAQGVVRSFNFPDKSGTIALIEDFENMAPKTKPTKLITNTSQYTAIIEDKDKFLVFANPIDFVIPSAVFSADDEISFRNKAEGDLTVVPGAGMAVDVVSSQSRKLPQFAFGGVRFESGSRSGLLGQLKPI